LPNTFSGISYLYYLTLIKALEVYPKFLCVEAPPASKVYRLFTDEKFRKAYMFEEFPDKEFVGLFLSAMKSKELKNLELLIKYIFNKMGGFNINGWRLRTKTENISQLTSILSTSFLRIS